ncbi:MAG TPA: tetratricopeptide repeat protein [Chloroflexia bacterium]|nr:tetratricopeptide repeat protein [Chloroflexia bacterium]
MGTSIQAATPPASTPPPTAMPAAVRTAARRGWLRIPIILGGILLLVVGVYVYAWFDASGLSSQYLRDADTSYGESKYLEALVGYEDFDQATNKYVTRGGYMHVRRIWNDSYAWPVPAGVERANQRIDEIINDKMTVEQAEQFVRANTGKNNPYLGIIYLRLGELYEQRGDTEDARGVYEAVVDSFSDQPDLVDQARAHLARLDSK